MLASELAARANKLDREHRERAEKERRQRDKERMLAERQAQREAAAAAQRAAKLVAAEALRLAEEDRAERLRDANGGSYLRLALVAAPSQDEEQRAQRGLRRSGDKVRLPPSAGQALMDQGVMWRGGALTFELAVPSGARTHAGLLDFTAPEGVVMVTRKVAECLWGPSDEAAVAVGAAAAAGGGTPEQQRQQGQEQRQQMWREQQPAAAPLPYPQCVSGPVTVTFRRLETGSFCRLQPALRAFHEHVAQLDRRLEEPEAAAAAGGAEGAGGGGGGGVMRAALEAALSRLTVLTEGDWVRAELPGVLEEGDAGLGEDAAADPATRAAAATSAYLLRVVELRPGAAVSIMETDLATDVGPSIETEGYLRAEEERRAREEERARQGLERAAAEAEAAQRAAADAAARRAAAALRRRAACAAALPPEPDPSDSSGAVTCALRLPAGARVQRRFPLGAPLSALFDFAESAGAAEQVEGATEPKDGGVQPPQKQRRAFALVSQFPRRVFVEEEEEGGSGGGRGGDRPLRDCGLSAGEQVALMVEAAAAPSSHQG